MDNFLCILLALAIVFPCKARSHRATVALVDLLCLLRLREAEVRERFGEDLFDIPHFVTVREEAVDLVVELLDRAVGWPYFNAPDLAFYRKLVLYG